MMTSPLVSVLMPVKDPQAALFRAAVASILDQSYTNFELLVIEAPGSSHAASMLSEFVDARIRHVVADSATCLADQLNLGLELARGEFIARMDADDVSTLDRLERQIAFLMQHPEVGVVGSSLHIIDETNRVIGFRAYPLHPAEIERAAARHNPMAHPAVMFRKQCVNEHGGYRERVYVEDYEMWSRWLAAGVRFANLPEPVLFYRIHSAGMKAKKVRELLHATVEMKARYWRRRMSLGDVLRWRCEKLLLFSPPAFVLRLFKRSQFQAPRVGTEVRLPTEQRGRAADGPLRIAFCMPYFAPAYQLGGPVTQAELLCEELSRRGHQVRVVTLDVGQPSSTPRDQWVDLNGYQVWYAKTRWFHRVAPYIAPVARRPLEEVLSHADVLQLRVGLTWLSYLATRIARQRGVRYVYNADGALCPLRLAGPTLLKKLVKSYFVKKYESNILRGAALVQVLTEKELHDVKLIASPPRGTPDAEGIVTTKVMSNGVALPAAREEAHRAVQRTKWGIGAGEVVILFLGRLDRLKGIDLILAVADELFTECSNVRVVFVGGGEEYAAKILRWRNGSVNGERLILHGPMKPAETCLAFAAADIFILPSYSEGMSVALLEAMAHSLPVVITTGCNMPQVAEQRAGKVIAPDGAELLRAMIELVRDEPLRACQGENARRLVEKEFSIASAVDQLVEVYQLLATSFVKGL